MNQVRRSRLVQYGITIIVCLSGIASGAWLSWPTSIISRLYKGSYCCEATKEEVTTMVALMDFGNLLTPIPASYLCNMYGRKPVMLSTAVMFAVTSLCTMAANNMWYLYVGRVIAGMAKGITFAVVPLFIAEIAEVKIRGALCTIFGFFMVVGVVYDFLFGMFDYEVLNIANFVIPVVMMIGFTVFPESPYYLAMKDNMRSAEQSLRFYRQLPPGSEVLKAELEQIKTTVDNDMQNKARFIDVVTTKSRRRALLIVSVASLAQRVSGISPLLAYSQNILPDLEGGPRKGFYALLFSIVLALSNCVGLTLVDKWGRKNLIILSTVSAAVVDAAFGFFFLSKSNSDWLPYACLIIYALLWGLGLSHIPSILVAELFPTNVKSYASSIMTIILGVTSFLINEIFGELIDKYYGKYLMFFLFSFSSIICSVLFVFIQFETKGKTFQEIQLQLKEIVGESDDDKRKPKC